MHEPASPPPLRMDALKSLLLVVCVGLVATVVILLCASGGDGVFEHKGLARVEHSKDDVFEWLCEPELRVQWIAGLSSSKSDALQVEKGSHLVEIVGGGADRRERKIEVLEAEPGLAVVLRITEPGRTFDVHYRLSPNQSSKRTRVDYTLSGHFDAWWARVLEPFMSARLVEELEADLARLDQKLRQA